MDGTGTSLIDPNLKTLQIGWRYSRRILLDDEAMAITPRKPNEWRALGECIGDHQSLKNLVFYFCNYVVSGDDLKDLIRGASRNKSISEIKFYCCFSERGGWGSALGSLAAVFENNRRLASLAVWRCRLDRDAVRSLLEALASPACSLRVVDWQCTRMAHEDWTRLAASLAGLRNLKRLLIADSFAPESCNCNEVEGLLCHPRCALEELSLARNRLEDVGLAALRSAIANNKTLTRLGLDFLPLGGISSASWRSFVSILRHHRCRLQLISFNHSAIGEDKLATLGHAITANNTLRVLYLINLGEISPAGWRSFSSILKNNRSLSAVFLQNNSIDDCAMEAFADAVRGNHSLEKLWLNENRNITNRGWESMRKALCDESSVDSVYDSNHVLHQLYGTNTPHIIPELPNCLEYLLRLNGGNVNDARCEKILLHFLTGNGRMEPIGRVESNAFPHLLSWIGRGGSRRCHEAMFNVLRKVPLLFGNISRVSRRSKRKRRTGS